MCSAVGTSSGVILGQENGLLLVRALIIALIVVSPFWLWQRRKIRAAKQADEPTAEPEPIPAAEELSTVIAHIGEAAATATAGTELTIEVPIPLMQDGRLADPAIAGRLIKDSMRRSGLTTTAEIDTGSARLIECVKQ